MRRTHYDTLKVTNDAPIEVIRAAYRVLCQKYHPDLHPSDASAALTMALLNQAYEVLSDPERRQAYDALMHQPGAQSSPGSRAEGTPSRPAHVWSRKAASGDAVRADRGGRHLWQWGLLCASVLLAVSLAVVLLLANRPQMNTWVVATPVPTDHEAYIRQLAREVIVGRDDGPSASAAVPPASDSAASPSSSSSQTEKGRETPADGARTPGDAGTPRPHSNTSSARRPADEVSAAGEGHSFSRSSGVELPPGPASDQEMADPANHFSQPGQASEAQPGNDIDRSMAGGAARQPWPR